MTIQEIQEVDGIEKFLLITPSDNPAEIIERLSTVSVYHSRLGGLLVLAKKELRMAKASEISKTIISIAKEQYLSAKAQNALVDSICVHEQYEVDRLERLQASCVHDIDAQRSILSYLKTEVNNVNYYQNQRV